MKPIGLELIYFILLLAAVICIAVVARKKIKRAEERAVSDAITGGRGARGFAQTANRLLADQPPQYAMVAMELKNFTQLRKSFGVAEADRVLVHLQAVLEEQLGKNEPSAHIDSGIFCLLIKNRTAAEVEARLKRIDERANAFNEARLAPYPLELAFGIFLPEEEADIAQMRECAFDALTHAGKERCHFYKYVEEDSPTYKQELAQLLEASLSAGDFAVYLQPKVRLSDSRIVGAEALVRWRHPVRGMLTPEAFLPVLEEYRMMHLVDRFLFEAVCKKLAAWRLSGKKPCPISLNLSQENFSIPDFAGEYAKICRSHALEPELFEFEFSETCDDPKALGKAVRQLHSHGFKCALDHFGKEELPLAYLREIEPDTLKLDSSLFSLKNNNRRNRFTIEAILKLAAQMQLQTVAEGIDNASQLQYLKQAACDVVQGFYYFRPMPIDEFLRVAYLGSDLRFLEETESNSAATSLPQQLCENVVLFSLHLAEDTITFSDAFSPLLEQELSFHDAMARLRHSKLIHENDRHDFFHMLERTKLEPGWVTNSLRFYTAADHYDWLELRLHREPAASGEAIISGTLINIAGWKNAVDRWKEKANRDALTGLYNREYFEQSCARALNEPTSAAAMIFIDIDDFKQINDTLGHTVGDDVIRWVSKRVLGVFRHSDVVARYGGDEFVVFANGIERNELKKRLEQLCEVFRFPYRNGALEYTVSGSIGAAVFPEDGAEYRTLLEHADSALYTAKRRGKNRFVLYEAGMEEDA